VLRDLGRVERKARELRAELQKRGVPAEELRLRGFEDSEETPPVQGEPVQGSGRRSPPARWAAFVLSGDPGFVKATD
jgi:hypothetical protein